jgi:hypothetical protein
MAQFELESGAELTHPFSGLVTGLGNHSIRNVSAFEQTERETDAKLNITGP